MNTTKILICGIGAIGGYYAHIFEDSKYTELKVLTDEQRLNRYIKNPRVINGVTYNFNYILPTENNFTADLIIIATKSSGLEDAINNIKNFVGENTIILSFLNGISSEEKIKKAYGDKVLYSYLLGHTFFRKGNTISHDGQANVIFGSTYENDTRVEKIKNLFKKTKISYVISNNIKLSLWEKFCFNCCVNQLSAITKMTFGEIKNSPKCINIMKKICEEITIIGEKEGVHSDFYKSALKSLDRMIPDGKTSMLQDIESNTIPETDIFSKTVIELGEKHNIDTPYNRIISEIIDCIADKINASNQ